MSSPVFRAVRSAEGVVECFRADERIVSEHPATVHFPQDVPTGAVAHWQAQPGTLILTSQRLFWFPAAAAAAASAGFCIALSDLYSHGIGQDVATGPSPLLVCRLAEAPDSARYDGGSDDDDYADDLAEWTRAARRRAARFAAEDLAPALAPARVSFALQDPTATRALAAAVARALGEYEGLLAAEEESNGSDDDDNTDGHRVGACGSDDDDDDAEAEAGALAASAAVLARLEASLVVPEQFMRLLALEQDEVDAEDGAESGVGGGAYGEDDDEDADGEEDEETQLPFPPGFFDGNVASVLRAAGANVTAIGFGGGGDDDEDDEDDQGDGAGATG
jgi:hypothetical protein